MALLNQIIAIEKGVKSRAYAALSEFNKAIQKPDLFNGGVRSYEPLAEGGEALPSERKRVQFVVPQVLRAVEKTIGELMGVNDGAYAVLRSVCHAQ
jgi:hypothetical protein